MERAAHHDTSEIQPASTRGHHVEDLVDSTIASIGWLGVRTLLVGMDVRDRLKASASSDRGQSGHIPAQRRPGSTDAA
jgi:hypothetical protein